MEQYLRENGVPFEEMRHERAYTMQEAAAALHVSGKQVAKVVIVKADDRMAMLVIPAPYRLNMEKVRDLLKAEVAELAREDDFSECFPDCIPGAMPPFGNLYGLPVYVDQSLARSPEIIFRAGTHSHTMQVAYSDFARLVQPTLGEFAYLV
jgi:Ala-tRNA(Pro) deacylase